MRILVVVLAIFTETAGGFASPPPPRQRQPLQGLKAVEVPHAQFLTDLFVVGTLGFAVEPVLDSVFDEDSISPQGTTDVATTCWYTMADNIQVAARTYGVLLIVHALAETRLVAQVIPVLHEMNLRQVAPTVALTVWAFLSLSQGKRIIFEKATATGRLGRVAIYDGFIDVLLGLLGATVILNELPIDFGLGMQSILAGGSLGALFFSFASKELATNIIAGFAVQAWRAFAVGDYIRLGDGTEGTVATVGLVETVLVGSDDIRMNVPNSQLYNQRLSNLSRVQTSQVLQTLRFQYADIQRAPDILNDIKNEIKESCPDLIADGSKPFRAVLSSYEPDHIRTEVNCHFNIPPGSQQYVENREKVLLAIARAMDRNQAEFALPSIYYRTIATDGQRDMLRDVLTKGD